MWADTVNVERYANRNPENHGWLGDEVIGQGKYKIVKKGTYDSGLPAADKYLKTGVTFSDDCFLDDVRASEAALPYIAGYIDYIDRETVYRGRVSIKLNMPTVWTQEAGTLAGQRMLREPYIERFQKFNSNSGAVNVTAIVAHALSHYSYHVSDGQELLCDLQGGKVGDSYVLSDVVLMSMSKRYGNTDLGPDGIENWLHAHRCTQFCCSGWKNWSGAQRLFAPVFSTTTTLDGPPTAPAWGQEFIRVKPSAICFTHDSIKGEFRDGHSLLETALQIAREEVGKRDIQMINVIRVEDGRLFALDNRRLAVFRLLEICGRVGTIKVTVESFSRWASEWNQKLTTTNGGTSIKVRGGSYRIGRTEADTRFYGLDTIRNARPHHQTLPDERFAIFLGSFSDN